MTIDLKLTPRKDALLLGHDNLLEVLVRATGPVVPEMMRQRRRLNIAIVIDRSGSMRGEPLNEAKRCAKAIVHQLAPDDFVSVIAYDSTVDVMCPAQPVSSIAAICAHIDEIQSGNMTAMFDGWSAGAEQAVIHTSQADISRILLLSDGNANRGLTDTDQIADRCAQAAAAGISTSTYGLGGHFNEDLMFAMAQAGAGNAYYGRTAQDLMRPFQQEFDLLKAIFALNPLLELSAPQGVRIEMGNDLAITPQGWRLPDIAYESEAWAIVRLHVPQGLVASGGLAPISLLTARVTYTIDEDNTGAAHSNTLALTSLPQAAYVALAEDELVVRRSQEVRFAESQRQAGIAARRGEWDEVDRIMALAREAARGNEWLWSSLESLERIAHRRDREHFSKEATSQSVRRMKRLTSADEGMSYSASIEDLKPSFLRRRDEEGSG